MYNVLIRPLLVEDAEISFQWRNDPEIWKFTGSRPDRYITYEIEKEWIKNAINETDSFRFAIIVDNKYIGNIQLTNVDKEKAQYHIFIGEKAFWGKGIGTLATYQLLRFSEERLNLEYIYLFVDSKNSSAIRLYTKCGFKKVSDEIKMIYNLSEKIKPKVSVFMLAYNHEPYINIAIDSILMQKTNFDFDIVIGEDYSIDNTRKIIEKISDNYPGKFKLLFNKRNIGALKNEIAVLKACDGEYIAMCEGDDFWTDPNKLQKQYDFMNAKPEYSLCFHKVEKLYEDGRKVLVVNKDDPTMYINGEKVQVEEMMGPPYDTMNLIMNERPCHTCSIFFRQEAIDFNLLMLSDEVLSGDYVLFLTLSLKGDFGRINETMAVYRRHKDGISSNKFWKGRVLLSNIQMLNQFDKATNYAFSEQVKLKIEKCILMELKQNQSFLTQIELIGMLFKQNKIAIVKDSSQIISSLFMHFIHSTKLYYLKRLFISK